MNARARVSDADRRRRLVARHHLGRTATTPDQAVADLVAMHSSDPITPYLGAWARVAGFEAAQLDASLYEHRRLWRMHAMRRTLFVVPAAHAAIFSAGACERYVDRERRRVLGWLEQALPDVSVDTWLADVEARLLAALSSHGGQPTTTELSELVPDLRTQITLGSGRWQTPSALSSRLLFLLAMEGSIVRTEPAGHWRSSQYRWAATEQWFGHAPEPLAPTEARLELARAYLQAFGPATAEDLCWWAGWTKGQTQRALTDLDAVAVDLDAGGRGFLLPDDVDEQVSETDGPVVALLPGLDPTPMGWKERDFYLDGHGSAVFDRTGNVGPTVWVDGRIVGGWAQRPDGEIVWRLLEDVGQQASDEIVDRAAELGEWLDGVVVSTRFPSPLERELRS